MTLFIMDLFPDDYFILIAFKCVEGKCGRLWELFLLYLYQKIIYTLVLSLSVRYLSLRAVNCLLGLIEFNSTFNFQI